MTTIAFDGRYMAVDSQLTQGDTKFTARKAFEFETPEGIRTVVMGCGTWADVQDAVKALEGGLLLPKGDYSLLLWADGDGVSEFCGPSKASRVDLEHYANGSGAQAALGALKMGASAARAVEVASEIDVSTGGPVVVFDTKTRRFTRPRTRRRSGHS
ncbi:hypothetical protein [Lysobacter sp. Hz 25]|uniref:hypothetical protein n=1 Tax=Lysobacter sp. Hz 25 TaxID=3383698 RepID=UPI0038D3DA5F